MPGSLAAPKLTLSRRMLSDVNMTSASTVVVFAIDSLNHWCISRLCTIEGCSRTQSVELYGDKIKVGPEKCTPHGREIDGPRAGEARCLPNSMRPSGESRRMIDSCWLLGFLISGLFFRLIVESPCSLIEALQVSRFPHLPTAPIALHCPWIV